ncbi:pentapeptide repeat-containing protein [Campylobacter coli]
MEENKLTVIVNKLEPYDELEVGLEKLVLKIECSYKDKPLVKYLYADGDDFFSIDFIYETMKDHEEFNNLIEKHMVNDVIIYKVLVPVEIIGRNRLLVDEDRKNIEKRYNTKDLNTLSQRAMNKKVITVEKKFHSYSDLNKRKFKTIFLENFSIFGFFDGEINISENIFYKLCSFKGFIESKGDLKANNCDFIGNVDFRIQVRNKSLNNVSFKNSIFRKEVTFSNIKFLGNTNFNNSHFKDYVDFHECEFEKTACFYGVRFDKTPNFSQVVFKDSVNLINVKTNFDFENLNTTIESMDKPKNETANDFRDSFRTFKNALIKDNNLLDASNFHKYELYCKEIELENKKDKTLKDRIDKWQLFFYRKLCDHHTDILQSLNSLILVIGIFGILSVVMVFGFNYSLGYKPILEHWYFSLDFYNHHINSTIQDNYLFMIVVNLIMLFAYLILVGLALCLKCIREFFIIISYVITLLALAVSPKILIPAMGFFTDKRAMLDPLSTIGGIYTIVFGFVVFSFIKTIRKNSIVPS